MKQREYEAVRIEADYMHRALAAISDRPLESQKDILQSIRTRIEQQLLTEPVTLTEMARVLQLMGNPETVATEQLSSSALPVTLPVAQVLEYSSADNILDRADAADLLRRIWIGQAIIVLALFIPVINLEFCSIIGSIIIASSIFRRQTRPAMDLRIVGELEWACAGMGVGMASLSAATLFLPSLALFQLLLFIPLIACSMVSYWKQLSTFAAWVALSARPDLADSIRLRRNIYVFVIVPAIITLGITVNNVTNSSILAQFLLLPLIWVTGYFFVLAPITQTRNLLLD